MTLEQDSLAVRTGAADIRSASEWLGGFCSEKAVPDDQILRLDLCLNEVLANIAAHGGDAALDTPVHLTVVIATDDEQAQATLTVSDSGKPFNPLAAEAKPQAHSLSDAEPGGLGLTMLRYYSDHLDYGYLDGKNHLKIMVQWARLAK